VNLHSSLLRVSDLRGQIFSFLREGASDDQVESILGSWSIITRDVDRQVSISARRSWEESVSLVSSDTKLRLEGPFMSSVLAFLQRAILDPAGLYAYLNPVQVSVGVLQPRKAHGRPVPISQIDKDEGESRTRPKADEDEETEQDRKARLRIGGLGILQWLLGVVSFLLHSRVQSQYDLNRSIR
jgi:E3 ubiquitin-protein ligase listerin